MKKLIDYKDEIQKCSKCGLCQSVCPVYKITGNDCAVSRGKFIMLNGIIKCDLNLNKNIEKYLDMCLKCNACKDFCPSGIDARKIFITAKSECFKTSFKANFIKILNSELFFNLIMKSIKIGVSLFRFFKLDKVLKKIYPLLLNSGWLGKKIILLNEFITLPSYNLKPLTSLNNFSKDYTDKRKNLKIIYFKGCVNDYINPKIHILAENILKRMGINIIPTSFNCCGVPFLSEGNIEQFIKQAKFNLSQIPDDIDYFLTDCASCQNAFKDYGSYLEDNALIKKLNKINKKSLNIIDFIIENIECIEFNEKKIFTFHKPCHLDNINFINKFLDKAKNIEYIQMEEFNSCCGFAGIFAMKNPKISTKISVKKCQNALKTKADYILTSCPSCVLGISQGLIELDSLNKEKNTVKTLNFLEFIADAEKIC